MYVHTYIWRIHRQCCGICMEYILFWFDVNRDPKIFLHFSKNWFSRNIFRSSMKLTCIKHPVVYLHIPTLFLNRVLFKRQKDAINVNFYVRDLSFELYSSYFQNSKVSFIKRCRLQFFFGFTHQKLPPYSTYSYRFQW